MCSMYYIFIVTKEKWLKKFKSFVFLMYLLILLVVQL